MALTQVNGGMLDSVAQQVGFRNRIINGAMMIDQRNAGASVSVPNGAVTYITDRWNIYEDTSGSVTAQQSTTAPAGFKNSFLATVTSAGTATSNQLVRIQQRIEGFNIADLGWGTANAQPVAISFWVRSSLTGTYCVSIRNDATNRSYVATYAINSANTYEYKTVIIPGDTSGVWLTDNGRGMIVDWDLGSGSSYNTTAGSWDAANRVRTSVQTDWIATNGATFYITGVQLEKGSTATSFDYRPYGTELALCQRYYRQWFEPQGASVVGVGLALSGTTGSAMTAYNVLGMRTTPACSLGGANFQLTNSIGNRQTMTSTVIETVSSNGAITIAGVTASSVLTAGQATELYSSSSGGGHYVYATSEL